MSPRARAARLVRLVEAAIESGAFTPNFFYLEVHPRLGPCGCAVAAGKFVSGVDPDSVKALGVSAFDGISEAEAYALEAGYESDRPPSECAFFEAGRELRKFHPGVLS